MSPAWYAIYTRFQHEKSAAGLLERKAFNVFLPVYRAMHSWGGRTQQVILPLFPCYLFVQTVPDQKLDILRTAGVRWMVESAGRACEVPEAELESLRKICADGQRLEPHPFMRQGERVRIHAGPLAGTEGFFVRTKNQDRVVVSVELIRKGVSLEVDVNNLERVRDRPESGSLRAASLGCSAEALR